MERKQEIHRRRGRFHCDRGNLILLGIVLLAAVLVVGGTELIFRQVVKKHDDGRILQGVHIGAVDVSGMTKKEAQKAVESAVEAYGAQTCSFELDRGGKIEAALHELGFETGDIKAAVNKAETFGKNGRATDSYKLIRRADKGTLKHRIALPMQVSEKKVKSVLQARSQDKLSLPVNASVTQKDGEVVILKEKNGEAPNASKVTEDLNAMLKHNWDGKPISMKVSVISAEPEITEKDLAEVTDLLGTHTTYYGADGSGRSQNVESGAMHINGTLMQPGDEISANALMEPYTYENGYKEAASYESNTVVETMGGGICQVSTTLYNALLYAELEIVERYPHSMLVTYAEPSMDAAIAEDILDLVFKNNLQNPVYIEAVLADGNVTFNVYGKETRSPGRRLEFISETTESTPAEGVRYVATGDAIGYYGWQSAAHPQITAQLWKVVYENEEEVSRNIINYSSYVAAPETYGVGTASDDSAATERMNQAILSQDETTILNTMNEILYSGY